MKSTFTVFHLPPAVLDGLFLSDKLNAVSKAEKPQQTASTHYSTPQVDHAQDASMKDLSARIASATCHTCGGVAFADALEQRAHFKTDWHRANMARKLEWRQTHAHASEEDYPWQPVARDMLADAGTPGSSESSSEDESIWSESDISVVGDEPKSNTKTKQPAVVRPAASNSDEHVLVEVNSPYLWFSSAAADATSKGKETEAQDPEGITTVYGVHRRILVPKTQHNVHIDRDQALHDLMAMQHLPPPKKTMLELKMEKLALSQKSGASKPTVVPVPDLSQTSLWAVLSVNGGYFAGAIFDNRTSTVIEHKTFQRYTTRRKQGGSQSRQDNAMGRPAKSAGAQIRRYNERMLMEDIHALMSQWSLLLGACSRVFVRVARGNRKGFFGSALSWDDPRVRSLPVPMARPSLAELERAYTELIAVKVKTVDMARLAPRQDPADDANQAAPEVSGSESDHTLDPEPRPDLMAFLYHFANMMLDESQSDDTLVAYLAEHQAQLLDALGDPAMDLRYLESTDKLEAHKTPTLLHLAASLGRCDLIPFLIDNGEDPTVTNGRPPLFAGGKTAYEVSKDKRTRDTFRVYRSEHENDIDGVAWYKARVPEPLTREKMKENDEKAKEKRRKERERRKTREKEKKEKKERALAAEQLDQKAMDDALELAEKRKQEERTWRDNIHSMSESELRTRMLSMAYASANKTWEKSGKKQPPKQSAVPVRPVSPTTQRAIDRELRFKAFERRQQQQQQPVPTGSTRSTDSCTHCGKSLHGLVPFEQFDWRCCSIDCLHSRQAEFGI